MRRCPTHVVLLVTILIVTAPVSSAVAYSSIQPHADTNSQNPAVPDHQPDGDGNPAETVVPQTQSTGNETEPVSPEPPNSTKSGTPGLSSSLEALVDDGEHTVGTDGASGGTTVTVVVRAEPNRTTSATRAVSNVGGTVETTHGDLVQSTVPVTALEALANSKGVAYVRKPNRPDTNSVSGQGSIVSSSGLSDLNVSGLHNESIRGDNATVVVIDGGFNVSNPEISDNVVDYRDMDGTWTNSSGHGTQVTELVVDTAPNASVVLIEVDSSVELYNALDHIEENTSADVVTMSMSWYGIGPLNGESYLDGRIEQQVNSGITWTTSAGNMGYRSHWNGTWQDGNDNDRYNWTSSDEMNYIGNPTNINLVLNWNDWDGRYEDYDLYLYNQSGSIVASSTDLQTGTYEPDEEIYYSNTKQEDLYVAIHRYDANGTADFDLWFRGGSTPQYWTSTRSVTAPATEESIIAVGAVNASSDNLEYFSSRGPTIDGRERPTLTAPDNVETSLDSSFYGTSASTPYTAGVLALLHDKNESSTPLQKKNALTETAYAVQGDEPNNQAGAGHIDAYDAAQALPLFAQDTSCLVVDSPGTTTLNSSMLSTASCIRVTASDVVIAGNHTSLDGALYSATAGLELESGVDNVTVTNVTISNYDRGIRVVNATNATLRNVTLDSNERSIRTYRSTNLTIESVTAAPTRYGLDLNRTVDSRVENVTVDPTNDPYYGVILDWTQNVTVINATTTDQTWAGMLLSNATGSTVANLNASGSNIGVYGYRTDGTSTLHDVDATGTNDLTLTYDSRAPMTVTGVETGSGVTNVTSLNASVSTNKSAPATPEKATQFGPALRVRTLTSDAFGNVSVTYGPSPGEPEASIGGFVVESGGWERPANDTARIEVRDTVWTNVSTNQTVGFFGGEPALHAVPSSALEFGSVSIDRPDTKPIFVENTGVGPLNLTGSTIEGDDATNFTVDQTDANRIIEPLGDDTVSVTFDPNETTTYSTTLNLTSNDTANSLVSVTLNGTGARTPVLVVDSTSIDFERVQQTTSRRVNVTIRNDGSVPLNVTGTTITGYTAFTVASVERSVVEPGTTANITVTFAPPVAPPVEPRQATLSVATNDTTENVSLRGVDVRPHADISPMASLQSGIETGETITKNVTLSNEGTGNLTVTAITLVTDDSGFNLSKPTTPFTLASGATENATLTFTPPEAGNYGAVVRVEHDGVDQNAVTSQFNFSVGSATSGGSGGGGGGGGGAVLDPQTNVEPSQNGVDVDIDGATIGAAVDVRLVGKPTGEMASGVTLRNIAFESTRDLGSVEMSVSTSTAPPAQVPPPAETLPVTYVDIDHPDFGNDDVRETTMTFRLSKTLLEDHGVRPADVTVYRYRDGEWHEQRTEHTGAEFGKYLIEAEVEGFSTFALGFDGGTKPDGEASNVVVTEADTNVSGLYVDESVSVTAAVSNEGSSTATATIPLTIDGEQVDSTDVTLAAGETKQVSFTHRFSKPGTYDVAVDGTDAGAVRVEAENESSGELDESSTDNETGDSDDGDPQSTSADTPGFGILTTLVALLLLSVVRRRRDHHRR